MNEDTTYVHTVDFVTLKKYIYTDLKFALLYVCAQTCSAVHQFLRHSVWMDFLLLYSQVNLACP